MEQLRVAVCDDDEAALGIIASSLKDVFAKHGEDAQVALFPGALALQQVMRFRTFDLLLLDIDMPELDGITFARELREHGDGVDIMYISSREDKVFDSLRVHPVGFIRKSRFLDDMSEIVGSYLEGRRRRHEASQVVLQKGGMIRPIRASRISYIEGRRKDQIIHIAGSDETVVVRSSMRALEEELEPAGFLRVHQGYLVNYHEIKLIEDQDVVLVSGEVLPISRRKVTEVREAYLKLVQSSSQMVF